MMHASAGLAPRWFGRWCRWMGASWRSLGIGRTRSRCSPRSPAERAPAHLAPPRPGSGLCLPRSVCAYPCAWPPDRRRHTVWSGVALLYRPGGAAHGAATAEPQELVFAEQVIPTPSHLLDRISPIFPPFSPPFFARFHRLDETVPTSRKPEPRAKNQPAQVSKQ